MKYFILLTDSIRDSMIFALNMAFSTTVYLFSRHNNYHPYVNKILHSQLEIKSPHNCPYLFCFIFGFLSLHNGDVKGLKIYQLPGKWTNFKSWRYCEFPVSM